MALLLLLGPKVEQDGGAGRKGGGLEAGRILVAGELFVEDPLMFGRESLAAVLGREADAGQIGVEEHALYVTFPGDRGQLRLIAPLIAQRADPVGGRGGSQIGPDE